jgi:PemK-like, MazF-like toxin of type II toxin-antitoxin system
MKRNGLGSEALRGLSGEPRPGDWQRDSEDAALRSDIPERDEYVHPDRDRGPYDHEGTALSLPIAHNGTTSLCAPTRVDCTFRGKRGQVVLDQIRTVDRSRLVKRLGKLTGAQSANVLAVLAAMFAE